MNPELISDKNDKANESANGKKNNVDIVPKQKDIVPSATLYLRNLPTKLKVTKLKELLYVSLSSYGKILDIVANKLNLRGQAFVVFSRIEEAKLAKEMINHQYPMKFSKKVIGEYSRTKSQITKVVEGEMTFHDLSQSKKRKRESENTTEKRRRIAISNSPSQFVVIENLPVEIENIDVRRQFMALVKDREGVVDILIRERVAEIELKSKAHAKDFKIALDGFSFVKEKLSVNYREYEKRTDL